MAWPDTALRKEAAFDPRERGSETTIGEEIRLLANHPIMSAVLEASNVGMFVVNRQLEIVSANGRALDQLRHTPVSSILGCRIGEALLCANLDDAADCGSKRNCLFCGALNTILESRVKNRSVVGEHGMGLVNDGTDLAAEFSVMATPLVIDGHAFTVVSMQDVSDRKRREFLERLFVHDLKNYLQGIIGWSEILAENPTNDTEHLATRISALTRWLGEEIETHRLLLAAESHQLTLRNEPSKPVEVLQGLKILFAHHQAAYGKAIDIIEPVADVEMKTDPTVLSRILVNMIHNALEATEEQGGIRIGCTALEDACQFYVWNAGKMSDEAVAHLFKRSFSTKAPIGRGLGTYSMKLFGERVLGGKVYFTSDEPGGTTFFFELPLMAHKGP